MKLTHISTKKKLVEYALRELVKKLKRKKRLSLEGKVEWPGNLGELRKGRVWSLLIPAFGSIFLKGANSSEQRILYSLINDEEDIAIAGIILAEILQGIQEDKDFQTMKGFLLDFPIFKAKSIGTCLRAAQIYRDWRKGGWSEKRLMTLSPRSVLKTAWPIYIKTANLTILKLLQNFKWWGWKFKYQLYRN